MGEPRAPALDALQRLSAEIESGEIVFPTSIDVSLRIRHALEDPDLNLNDVAKLIVAEPVLGAKTLRMANSVAFNRSGMEVRDIRTAVSRVGLEPVRMLTMSLVMRQMVDVRSDERVRVLARDLWEHTVHVAALSYVIARRLSRLNADTAMFAGIVHEIGQFYLLARASTFPELLERRSELGGLMYSFSKVVGRAVLEALEVPDSIIEAVDDQDLYGGAIPPASLADVLFLANSLTPFPNPFSNMSAEQESELAEATTGEIDDDTLATLIEESKAELESIVAALQL